MIPRYGRRWKSQCWQQVMPQRHHRLVGFIFAQQFLIAALGHPLSARKMSVMDLARPFRLGCRIDAEEDFCSLAPIGTVSVGIKQPQIQNHMLAVVSRQLLALRRFIKELRFRLAHHRIPGCPKHVCACPLVLTLIQDSVAQNFSEKWIAWLDPLRLGQLLS